MSVAQVLFYTMAFIVVGSALFVAATKNLVRSIFMFFITLFALAGLYVLAMADFVAITQIVIYVGGILVLILFAFMLSGKETLNIIMQQRKQFISLKNAPALLFSALFLMVLLNMLFKVDANSLGWIKNTVELKNNIQPDAAVTENI